MIPCHPNRNSIKKKLTLDEQSVRVCPHIAVLTPLALSFRCLVHVFLQRFRLAFTLWQIPLDKVLQSLRKNTVVANILGKQHVPKDIKSLRIKVNQKLDFKFKLVTSDGSLLQIVQCVRPEQAFCQDIEGSTLSHSRSTGVSVLQDTANICKPTVDIFAALPSCCPFCRAMVAFFMAASAFSFQEMDAK